MVARATAPNAVGPGSVFPDAAKWDSTKGVKGIFQFRGHFYVLLTEYRRGANSPAVILGCSHLSGYHCCRLLLVLSQRTTR
jgi:hypothetical protein